MKHLILFSLLLATAYGLSQEDATTLRKKMMKNADECQGETGANAEDVTHLIQRKTPKRKEAKCFVFCMHKKVGFQDEAGKISPAGIEAWLGGIKGMDADLGGKMKQVADKCIPQINDSGDSCDTAAITFDCYNKVAKELGVQMAM